MTQMFNKLRLALARQARTLPSFRGQLHLLRAIDRALRAGGGAVDAEIGGVIFRLDTEDVIDFKLLYRASHQSNVVDYLSARLGEGPKVFWDVGANVGSFALPIALRNRGTTVHAFEPSPPVFARLSANMEKNPTLQHRVHGHHLALGDESGTARFFVSSEPFNSGVGGLGPSRNRTERGVDVPIARGDDLLATGRVPVPDLIKIDVEGFELEVLRGLDGFLRRANVEVVFEHEPYRLRERSLGPRAVIDHFRSLGFDIREIRNSATGETAALAGQLERSCDLVACKAG